MPGERWHPAREAPTKTGGGYMMRTQFATASKTKKYPGV